MTSRSGSMPRHGHQSLVTSLLSKGLYIVVVLLATSDWRLVTFPSCGRLVGNLRTALRTTARFVPSPNFCTNFVRSLWVNYTFSTRVMRTACAHFYYEFLSVSSLLVPTIHRPYYYVYL